MALIAGGLEGADAHCQKLAAAGGAAKSKWRAYLSLSAADEKLPLTRATGSANVHGTMPRDLDRRQRPELARRQEQPE